MRKPLPYRTILLLLCVALTGCKSTKPAATKSDIIQPDKGALEVQFGYLFINGCSDRIKGNLKDAQRQFEECLNIHPDAAPVHYELGMICKLLGSHEEAVRHAKTAADADPNNEWYQLLLIECYKSTNRMPQAISLRESLVKRNPTRDDIKEDLAIDYSMNGQFDKALKIYNELEKRYGINEQITLNKVKLLKSQGKARDAATELEKLSNTNPSDIRYLSFLGSFYEESNEPEKAKAVYDRIVAIDPDDPGVNLSLHDYYSLKGNPDKAYFHLEKAFRNKDLDVSIKSGIVAELGKMASMGDTAALRKGTALSLIMTHIHPKAGEAHAAYGNFLMMKEDNRGAAVELRKAVLLDRKDPRVWDNLLQLEYGLRHFDSLVVYGGEAIDVFPSQPRFYLYQGLGYFQQKEYAKSASTLKDGLSFVNDNGPLMLDYQRALGDALFNSGDPEGAYKAFDTALQIDPDNTYVLNNYSYYLALKQEHLDLAQRLSAKSLQLKPNDRSYMDTYGWVLYQSGKYSDAVEWLQKASSSGVPDATIAEHYGDALFKMNRLTEALEQWKEAKRMGGDAQRLDQKIREKNVR